MQLLNKRAYLSVYLSVFVPVHRLFVYVYVYVLSVFLCEWLFHVKKKRLVRISSAGNLLSQPQFVWGLI